MRISYALILAAIAVFEGCKNKDAADGNKGNGEGVVDNDDDQQEEEQGEVDGGNLGGDDPNKLQPNGDLAKANAQVEKHKKEIVKLEGEKVKLDKDVKKAEKNFEKANNDLVAAESAAEQVVAKSDALIAAVNIPSCPIRRLQATNMPEHLGPIVNAIEAVPDRAVVGNARISQLARATSALASLSENRPTGWTPGMTLALTNLQGALLPDRNAVMSVREPRTALIEAVAAVAPDSVPENIRLVANQSPPDAAAIAQAITEHRRTNAAEYAADQPLALFVEPHDRLVAALQQMENALANTERLKAALLALIDPMIPPAPADAVYTRLTEKIAAFRAATGDAAVQTTKGELLAAIEAIPTERRTPIATQFNEFTRARAAATNLPTLRADKQAKETTLQQSRDKVAPLEEKIKKEKSDMEKAQKAVDKLKAAAVGAGAAAP